MRVTEPALSAALVEFLTPPAYTFLE